MTTTTSTTAQPATRTVTGASARLRTLVAAAGKLLTAIGSRWSDFIDSGQLGPDDERVIGRYTGARI
jgi:hypothetical protein